MERDILNRKITKKNGEKVPIRTLKLQEQLKYEIADELGLFEKIEKSGWDKDITYRLPLPSQATFACS